MEETKVLNIYKLKIYQVLTCMFKIKLNTAIATFQSNIQETSHHYPTIFCKSNFVEGNILSNQTKLAASSQGIRFLKTSLQNKHKKNLAYSNGFKISVKT